MIISSQKMETVASPVFRLNGIDYLPHYREALWVQPNMFIVSYNKIRKANDYTEDKSKRLTAAELFNMGAELISKPLWLRSWTEGWQTWLKP